MTSYAEELKKQAATLGPLKEEAERLEKIDSKEIEELYAAAYTYYEAGDYAKSSPLFTHLVLIDPFEGRFWKGLASSRQLDHKYEEALHAWAVLALVENHQPDAHYHAAECLLMQGKKADALKALKLAQVHANGTHPMARPIEALTQRISSDGC